MNKTTTSVKKKVCECELLKAPDVSAFVRYSVEKKTSKDMNYVLVAVSHLKYL